MSRSYAVDSSEAASRLFGEYWMNLDNEVRQQYKANAAHTVVDLTPAQTQAWQDKLQPIYAQWLKATPGGEAVLAKYRALLQEVSAPR